MGPEFQFPQHEYVGRHAIEHPVDRPGEVERAGEYPLGTEAVGCDCQAGRGRTGNDAVHRPTRRQSLPANLAGERGQKLHLPHTHPMQPDAGCACRLWGQGGNGSGESLEGGGHGPAARDPPPSHPGQKGQKGDAIEAVEQHGKSQPGPGSLQAVSPRECCWNGHNSF